MTAAPAATAQELCEADGECWSLPIRRWRSARVCIVQLRATPTPSRNSSFSMHRRGLGETEFSVTRKTATSICQRLAPAPAVVELPGKEVYPQVCGASHAPASLARRRRRTERHGT